MIVLGSKMVTSAYMSGRKSPRSKIPTLAALGILTWDRVILALAALVPMFMGIAVGSWSAKFLSKRAFDRVILTLLAVIASKLIWDAWNSGILG